MPLRLSHSPVLYMRRGYVTTTVAVVGILKDAQQNSVLLFGALFTVCHACCLSSLVQQKSLFKTNL